MPEIQHAVRLADEARPIHHIRLPRDDRLQQLLVILRVVLQVRILDQDDIAFYYLSISSRAKNGTIWTTWNYPFSYSLKLAPQWKINRLRGDCSFLEMHESHRYWLQCNGVAVEALEELDPEKIQTETQKDLRAQITHNLAKGVLTKTAEGQIRYSWRGLFFIWFQFLRDLVRFS